VIEKVEECLLSLEKFDIEFEEKYLFE